MKKTEAQIDLGSHGTTLNNYETNINY